MTRYDYSINITLKGSEISNFITNKIYILSVVYNFLFIRRIFIILNIKKSYLNLVLHKSYNKKKILLSYSISIKLLTCNIFTTKTVVVVVVCFFFVGISFTLNPYTARRPFSVSKNINASFVDMLYTYRYRYIQRNAKYS